MNLVSKYLQEHKGLKLSIKSLSRRLNLKKRAVYHFIFQDNNIKRVSPVEVGSNAYRTNVFTIY